MRRTLAPIATDNPLARPTTTTTTTTENNKRQATLTPFAQVADKVPETTNRPNPSRLTPPSDVIQYNYDDHWREIDINLERVSNH